MNNNTLITLSLVSGLYILPLTTANASVHAVNSTSSTKTVVTGHAQPPITFASVWADKDGATHVAKCRIEGLEYKSYAPPSAPQWIGISSDEVESIAYAVPPPGYVGTWHHAPGPQWVLTLSGKWSVETTDGSKLVQGPGEAQFNADSSSHPRPGDNRVGHITRTVGNEPNVQLIIKLKPNAANVMAKGNCA